MIRNFMLESDNKRRRSVSQNLTPIKEFRKKTRNSKAIFKDFEQTGVRIVRLKKKHQLSTKQESLLERLQEHAKDIVDKINNIMRDSRYDAKDVLRAGYPLLMTRERASWMGFKEEDANQAHQKPVNEETASESSNDSNEESEKIVKPSHRKNKETQTESKDNDYNNFGDDFIEISEEDEEEPEEETSKDVSNNTNKEEAPTEEEHYDFSDIDIEQDLKALDETIEKYLPLIEIPKAERADTSWWSKFKTWGADLVNDLSPSSISSFFSGLGSVGKIFAELPAIDAIFGLIEAFETAAKISATTKDAAEISAKCAEMAAEKFGKGGKLIKGARWSTQGLRYVILRFGVPTMIKLSNLLDAKVLSKVNPELVQKAETALFKLGGQIGEKSGTGLLLKAGAVLSKCVSGAFVVQIAVWLGELIGKSIYDWQSEKRNSGDQIKAVKNAIQTVMRQFNKGFMYLDFNTDNFSKEGLGLKEFMTYCEYEPLAYYMEDTKERKPLGMIYLAIYDPSRYKAGGGELEDKWLRNTGLESSIFTAQKANDNKNFVMLFAVPEKGDTKQILTARDAMGLMPDWLMVNCSLLGPEATERALDRLEKAKSSTRFINLEEEYEYLLDCDPSALSKEAKTKLNGTSIFKMLSAKCTLFVSQLFQMCANMFASAIRTFSDSERVLEGRDDFVTSGSLDLFGFVACGFSEDAKKHMDNSWKPFFDVWSKIL